MWTIYDSLDTFTKPPIIIPWIIEQDISPTIAVKISNPKWSAIIYTMSKSSCVTCKAPLKLRYRDHANQATNYHPLDNRIELRRGRIWRSYQSKTVYHHLYHVQIQSCYLQGSTEVGYHHANQATNYHPLDNSTRHQLYHCR